MCEMSSCERGVVCDELCDELCEMSSEMSRV